MYQLITVKEFIPAGIGELKVGTMEGKGSRFVIQIPNKERDGSEFIINPSACL